MALSKIDMKRRRKDEAIGESSKRTKVHAQRKFAQGAAGSNSPSVTPVKENKSKVNGTPSSPQEVFPDKRANTEDFLTFLCFRGSDSLPHRLNFFNTPTKQDKTSPAPSTSKDSQSLGNSPEAEESPKGRKGSLTKVKNKPTPVAVKALQEKYMKQRLEKKKVVELAKKVKGKIMTKTTRSTVLEERKKVASIPVKKTVVMKAKCTVLKRLNDKRLRPGLRSSGRAPQSEGLKPVQRKKIIKKKPKPQAKKTVMKAESQSENEEEEEESEEEENGSEKSPSPPRTLRRSSIRPTPPATLPLVKKRPSRKTKEAATIYMEMLTKDLRSPDEDYEDERASDSSVPDIPVPKRSEPPEVPKSSQKTSKKEEKSKKDIKEKETKAKVAKKKPEVKSPPPEKRVTRTSSPPLGRSLRNKRARISFLQEELISSDEEEEEEEIKPEEKPPKKLVVKKKATKKVKEPPKTPEPPKKSKVKKETPKKEEEKFVRRTRSMPEAREESSPKPKPREESPPKPKPRVESPSKPKPKPVKKAKSEAESEGEEDTTQKPSGKKVAKKAESSVEEEGIKKGPGKKQSRKSEASEEEEAESKKPPKKLAKKAEENGLEDEGSKKAGPRRQTKKVDESGGEEEVIKRAGYKKQVKKAEESEGEEEGSKKAGWKKQTKKGDENGVEEEVIRKAGPKKQSKKLDEIGEEEGIKKPPPKKQTRKTDESGEEEERTKKASKKQPKKGDESEGEEEESKKLPPKKQTKKADETVAEDEGIKKPPPKKQTKKADESEAEEVSKKPPPRKQAKKVDESKVKGKEAKVQEPDQSEDEQTKKGSKVQAKRSKVESESETKKPPAKTAKPPPAKKAKSEPEVVEEKKPPKEIKPKKSGKAVEPEPTDSEKKKGKRKASEDSQVPPMEHPIRSQRAAKIGAKRKMSFNLDDEEEFEDEEIPLIKEAPKKNPPKPKVKVEVEETPKKEEIQEAKKPEAPILVVEIPKELKEAPKPEVKEPKRRLQSTEEDEDKKKAKPQPVKQAEPKPLTKPEPPVEKEVVPEVEKPSPMRRVPSEENFNDLVIHLPDGDMDSPKKPDSTEVTPEEKKKEPARTMSPSVAETWIQAFKHVKIPKSGKLSPVPQGVKPFSRKGFPSPSRPEDSKGPGPSSPARKLFGKEPEPKVDKPEEKVEKTLTQLQYEKRTSQFVSSLKESPFRFRPHPLEAPEPPKPAPQVRPLFAGAVEPQRLVEGGKHMNLPLPVEHTLRKQSPTLVSRKPPKVTVDKDAVKVVPRPVEPLKREEEPLKKKVNMTAEEIKRWLNDSTSSGIEHTKDCGIFERNQCECRFKSSSRSVEADEPKAGEKSIVAPPIQLKELGPDKFSTEATISACKVDDYKKILSKPNKPEPKIKTEPLFQISSPKTKGQERTFKSSRSMTDEEMCKFDFRFERIPSSPNESGSEVSSPTPRDDVSSNDEMTEKSSHEQRKPIFHQRRSSGTPVKRPPSSKSPSAFSPENESSVYAFEEPDAPPPSGSKPFRRGSKGKVPDSPSSSSIAVQVNLETESALECSTQTERGASEDGHVFYIPIQQSPGDSVPSQEEIQGVAVKLDTEGPDQRVIMRAKLVTKSSTSRPQQEKPPKASPQKPEQKVRPLANKHLPVVSVSPTVRTQPKDSKKEAKTSDQATGTDEKTKSSQGTQSDAKVVEPTPTSSKPKSVRTTRLSTDSQKAKAQPSLSVTRTVNPASLEGVLEAPVFYPTEKEFQDPLDYISKITPEASKFGICRIVPPPDFKPECKVSDDMRFTSYNQYVHKMLHRWGPSVKELTAIKKYLATQSITLNQVPWIGGMEVDLPRLYQTVQQCGGLKEVIEKKRWTRVADAMKIPKSAQDRVTKLDDIYCKYLLPYDTLSHEERNKLLAEVEREWQEREKQKNAEAEKDTEESENEDDESEVSDFTDECITKGRNMALNAFYRIARNTMAMWFKDNASAQEVETEFWKHVSNGQQHVCVHSGSIDSGTWGYGFPTTKSSSTSKHPWNLKVLTNNSGSILRSIGPVMGVTVPTLHVGMLFSACCWYRDPHALPWVEYLHTGASKIWYGVGDENSSELRSALKSLLPRFIRDKPIWLASDTAMVPPSLLIEKGVSLCRTVQEPGQFILVFSKAFTSSICTGYVVSESVYFAQPSWLGTAEQVFKEIQESSEPTVFSLEKLLFCIANDQRTSVEVLNQVLPIVCSIRETEVGRRRELEKLGLSSSERLPLLKGRKKNNNSEDDYECIVCSANLHLSLVVESQENSNFCLPHAIDLLKKDSSQLKYCKLKYGYDEEEMEDLIEKVKTRIELKSQKKALVKGNSLVGGSSKS